MNKKIISAANQKTYIYLPKEIKKVLLNLSGGTDSAMLLWQLLKYLKEEAMKKEPSDYPKYTKVRRCITPEGEIVKNQLNPNKDFN